MEKYHDDARTYLLDDKEFDTISKEKNIDEQLNLMLETFNNKNILKNHKFFSALNGSPKKYVGNVLAPFYFAVYNWVDHLKKFCEEFEKINSNLSPLLENKYIYMENELRNYYLNKKMSGENINDIIEKNNLFIKLIKENINDELGYEDGERNLEKCHTTTYINFLHGLGFNDKLCISPAVEKFNKQLEHSLKNDPAGYHAAVLGGIEHFYIQISNAIATYCKKANIKQDHYTIHEIIDKKHSMDFFEIAIGQKIRLDHLYNAAMKGYCLLWDVFQELEIEYKNHLEDSAGDHYIDHCEDIIDINKL